MKKEEENLRNKWKRLSCIFLTLVMLGTLLTGCGGANKESGNTDTEESNTEEAAKEATKEAPAYGKLKVGILVGSSAMPVLYAQDQGWFNDVGLDVEIITFPTGAPINEAFASNQLDIASLGMAGIFGLGTGECVFLAEGNTAGGLGVFVREDSPLLEVQGENTKYPDAYGNAEMLKGKQFLLPLGTASQYQLLEYAAGFGLSEEDISQVHMEYPAAYQAFSAGEGDGVSLSPPYYFNCINEGYIEISGFDQDFIRDMVMARMSVVEERREEIVLFLEQFFRACEELSDDEVRFDYCIKKYKELGAEYTDETMNQEMQVRKYITKEMMNENDYRSATWLSAIAEFYVSTEKITADQVPVIEDSIDLSLLNEALGTDVSQ